MYFSQAKQGKNNWWLYIITIFIVFGVQVIAYLPVRIINNIKTNQGNYDIQKFQKTLDFSVLGIDQNLGLILLLFPTMLGAIALFYLMTRLHGKKPGFIFSYAGRFRWNRLWTALSIWLIITIIAELIYRQIDPGNYQFQFDVKHFVPLVIITLIFIPFQAGLEELLFRSYLMQGFGLVFKYRINALLLTSIIFGLMHSLNPEVDKFGFWNSMLFYVGFGLFAGLLVVFDNGIEMAIGIHTINNIFGCIFVTYQSSVLPTAALWKLKTVDMKLMNIGFLITSVLFLLIIAIIYKWKNWKKLFNPIKFQSDTE